MTNRRTLSWSTAMRELRNDRARRASVREERLRATAGLAFGPDLSSWRGHSGRRYIVGVHALAEPAILDIVDAVILAVRRREDGTAEVVDIAAASAEPARQLRTLWMSRVGLQGATEVHVHRLAEGEAERRAVIEDLRQDVTEAC